jgi:hypothetical protein
MTEARVVLVPFQGRVRRRGRDLALALAMLGRAVKVHERTERARHALGTLDSRPHAFAGYEHANPWGREYRSDSRPLHLGQSTPRLA